MQPSRLSVKVSITLPVQHGDGKSFIFVKPEIELEGVLEPTDNLEDCHRTLAIQATSLFMREATRQAAIAGSIVANGFKGAEEKFAKQAADFLKQVAK